MTDFVFGFKNGKGFDLMNRHITIFDKKKVERTQVKEILRENRNNYLTENEGRH